MKNLETPEKKGRVGRYAFVNSQLVCLRPVGILTVLR